MQKKESLLCLLVLPLLVACASDPLQHALALASRSNLVHQQIQTDPFLLTVFTKQSDASQPITLYIEGDGRAWLSAWQPSLNPTPHQALGLSLATTDASPNVIYIARPCQFTPLALDPKCNVSYWTDRRFSEEVIASITQAIDKLTASAINPRLNLVGYSGGAAVAVLVAARRSDVVSLRTVAGNLDHVAVNRLHDATPMKGSLNAIDQAQKIAILPQLHFSGAKDDIVPPVIAERFLAASQPTSCVRLRTIEQATHEKGWIENWPALLKIQPSCHVGY